VTRSEILSLAAALRDLKPRPATWGQAATQWEHDVIAVKRTQWEHHVIAVADVIGRFVPTFDRSRFIDNCLENAETVRDAEQS
jgi:hypothetical protein